MPLLRAHAPRLTGALLAVVVLAAALGVPASAGPLPTPRPQGLVPGEGEPLLPWERGPNELTVDVKVTAFRAPGSGSVRVDVRVEGNLTRDGLWAPFHGNKRVEYAVVVRHDDTCWTHDLTDPGCVYGVNVTHAFVGNATTTPGPTAGNPGGLTTGLRTPSYQERAGSFILPAPGGKPRCKALQVEASAWHAAEEQTLSARREVLLTLCA